MKRILVLALVLVLLLPAARAMAGATKYTFNDVTIDEMTVEIEASSKDGKKTDYTTCSYYSDGYATYLGYYEKAGFASTDADEVLDFCVYHFDDRDPH